MTPSGPESGHHLNDGSPASASATRGGPLLAAMLAGFAGLATLLGAPPPVRAGAGVLLALVLPGYALVAAASARPAGLAERAFLSVGLSLVLAVL